MSGGLDTASSFDVARLFDIENLAGEPLGYPLSYVELIGTLAGLASVWLATRANVWTWPTGVVNVVFLFALFYQVQLYADMLLQLFFLAVTLYGWWQWRGGGGGRNRDLGRERRSDGDGGAKPEGEAPRRVRPGTPAITQLPKVQRWATLGLVALGGVGFGLLFSRVHVWLPRYFPAPADYPYVDSFVLAASVAATYLLAEKKLESWWLWIAVDVVCVGLFFRKGIHFLALEYVIFLGLATYGLLRWRRMAGGEGAAW